MKEQENENEKNEDIEKEKKKDKEMEKEKDDGNKKEERNSKVEVLRDVGLGMDGKTPLSSSREEEEIDYKNYDMVMRWCSGIGRALSLEEVNSELDCDNVDQVSYDIRGPMDPFV